MILTGGGDEEEVEGVVLVHIHTISQGLTSGVCLKRSFKSISYLGTLCKVQSTIKGQRA